MFLIRLVEDVVSIACKYQVSEGSNNLRQRYIIDVIILTLPAVPTRAPKRPKKCKNRLDYRKCGKAAMKGKCFKSWWQYQCKATCKRCCGDIWGRKRCKRLKFLCKKKNKNGRDVRNKCRKTCGKC